MSKVLVMWAGRVFVGLAALALSTSALFELEERMHHASLVYTVLDISARDHVAFVSLRKTRGPRCLRFDSTVSARAGIPERWCAGDGARITARLVLGTPGRHGALGVVASDYALIPGELLPAPLVTTFDFVLDTSSPTGRRFGVSKEIHPPFDTTGKFTWSGASSREILSSVNILLGRARTYRVRARAPAVNLTFAGTWDERRVERLTPTLERIVEASFAGHVLRHTSEYSVAILPSSGNIRLTGSSGPLGTALSFDGYPDDVRPFELIAHRLTHTWSGYSLDTLGPPPGSDTWWWYEGVAAWNEIDVLDQLGLAPAEPRLSALRARYERYVRGEETAPTDSVRREVGHYLFAPLAMAELDRRMRRLSKGKKSLRQFLSSSDYREGSAASVRQSLSHFLGEDTTGLMEALVPSSQNFVDFP